MPMREGIAYWRYRWEKKAAETVFIFTVLILFAAEKTAFLKVIEQFYSSTRNKVQVFC